MSASRRLSEYRATTRRHPERSAGGEAGEAQSRDPVEVPIRWAAFGPHSDPHPGDYSVYILTNKRRTVLYIGITNDLGKRLSEHALGGSEFTRKHNATVLVFYEGFPDAVQAIAREKQLKRWSRGKKLALIGTQNPELRDLGAELFDVEGVRSADNPDLPRGPSIALRPPPAPRNSLTQLV